MIERRNPGIEYSSLHLSPEQVDGELVPALRTLKDELAQRKIEPLLWFLFGSAVKEDVGPTLQLSAPEVLVRELLGVRGKRGFNRVLILILD